MKKQKSLRASPRKSKKQKYKYEYAVFTALPGQGFADGVVNLIDQGYQLVAGASIGLDGMLYQTLIRKIRTPSPKPRKVKP